MFFSATLALSCTCRASNTYTFYMNEALIKCGNESGVQDLFISDGDAKQVENLLIIFQTYRNSK